MIPTFSRLVPAALLLTSAALAGAQSGAPRADLDPVSRARLPYLHRQDLDEKGQKIFDTLPGRRPDGELRGPLAFAAYSPGVAKALFDLHNEAVAGTLNPHVRELAIMVACRETNYNLEWNAHEASALNLDGRRPDSPKRAADRQAQVSREVGGLIEAAGAPAGRMQRHGHHRCGADQHVAFPDGASAPRAVPPAIGVLRISARARWSRFSATGARSA